MSLVEQLTELYLTEESWHDKKLEREEADRYHERLLSLGNIITVSDGDVLCGYVEFWRLNFEQWGRIVCGEPFSAFHENVQNGQIAYVANTYIRPEYRGAGCYKQLRDRFFEANRECTHFVGEARRKRSAPIKVFKRSQIMERITNG